MEKSLPIILERAKAEFLAGRWEAALASLDSLAGPDLATEDAEAAYWRSRIHIRLNREAAAGDYEQIMRRQKGSPQMTCWYVDLLWRSGQRDRAEQVWKTARVNRKVRAVAEAPLLESRILLRQGDLGAAKKVLVETVSADAVVNVERALLLAWIASSQDRPAEAEAYLRQAESGPYSPELLRSWRILFTLRHGDPGLRPLARQLAFRTGLLSQPATTAEPDNFRFVPWLWQNAFEALGRGSFLETWTWIQRALKLDPELQAVGDRSPLVRQALPELERAARSHALALAVRFTPRQPRLAPELFVEAAELLSAEPLGQTALAEAMRSNFDAAREALALLAERDEVSPRLSHHLALIFHRAACYAEEEDRAEVADHCWRVVWPCWLRVFAARIRPGESGSDSTGDLGPGDRAFLSRLVGNHRLHVGAHLSRNAMDAARRHWGYVQDLPALARPLAPALAVALEESAARFRADLAADYLTLTRDVMNAGVIPPGWRADYDVGLGYLRRLLSLDRDNVRLLTALIDICGSWFLDCYNNEAGRQLEALVERYTPFALKLARLVDEHTGELSARAALSDFYKFRGFVAAERAEKAALYREALRFNPENDNVRQLLAEMAS